VPNHATPQEGNRATHANRPPVQPPGRSRPRDAAHAAHRVRADLDGPVPSGPARPYRRPRCRHLGRAAHPHRLPDRTRSRTTRRRPAPDRFGRRIPLLVGITAYLAASALCAISPSIETLVLARLVQGLAGAVGIVIAQAAGRDVYEGGALIRYYGRLTVVGGLAAIVGPVIGGQLARVTDWRGQFVFLAAIGVLLLVASFAIFGETLPTDQRTSGGIRRTGRDFWTLLSDRLFVGAVLICGLTYAALFAYLSGATYILQGVYGLSPQGYSIAFGANSLGFMIFGYLGGRTAERWSERGTLVIGIGLSAAAALGLLATGLFALPLPVVLASLFVLAAGTAVASPPTSSLALADYPELAGTASSVLGLARFRFGGIAAPLVGLGGAEAVLPLGIVTVASIALAAVAHVVLVRPAHGTDPDGDVDPTRTADPITEGAPALL
jgi:DHA1 family bicyclomycin/chloramphenicol resistance-like MFS transporter